MHSLICNEILFLGGGAILKTTATDKISFQNFFVALSQYQPYAAGIALASPFLAELLGWKVALILILPWAFLTVISRPRMHLSSISAMFLVLIVWHVLSQVYSPSKFGALTLKDALIATVLILIASTISDVTRFLKGFSLTVLFIGLVTSVVGLAKLFLQDRGYLIDPILRWCPGQYPQGSNICGDYNLMGLTWLASLAVLISWRINLSRLMHLIMMVPLIAAGLAVGSRRFLILLPLLLVLWPIISWRLGGIKKASVELFGVSFSLLLAWVSLAFIAAPEQFERFRFGDEPFTVNWRLVGNGPPTGVYSPNRAYPEVIFGTIGEGSLEARVERWKFGLDLARSNSILGSGFSYQEAYSERFVEGFYLDYPHLPILSQALIGGVPLLILCLLIYVRLSIESLRTILNGRAIGLGMIFIVASGVAVISGDTMLSIATWVSVSVALAAMQHDVGRHAIKA